MGLVWNDGQNARTDHLHVVTDYVSPAYLVLRSNNDGEFDFDSITYLDDGFYYGSLYYGQIVIYGLRGTQVATQNYSIHSQSPRKLLVGHAFDTVDEVRIRVYDPADPTFSFTPAMGLFDDITLLRSPTTPSPPSTLIWRTYHASNYSNGILGYDAATDRSGKIVDADPNPYDSFLSPLAQVGDYLYTIVVGPENTYQLVRYDGINLEVLSDQLFQAIGEVTAYGDDVVFRGTLDNSTYTLYLYDTAAGTVSLLDGPSPAIRPIPQSPIVIGSDLLFFWRAQWE